MLDFHSAGYLSPASDVSHLLLTGAEGGHLVDNWDNLLEEYYEAFSDTVAEFGLNLKHLGASYINFKREVVVLPQHILGT